jgi:hypothetical protein
MINANELRIGNWVDGGLNGELFYQIKASDFLNTNFEITKPVYLTNKIIESIFKQDKIYKYRYYLDSFVIHRTLVDFSLPENKENLCWQLSLDHAEYLRICIRYMHQLQNLYFALTGTELIYTPKK